MHNGTNEIVGTAYTIIYDTRAAGREVHGCKTAQDGARGTAPMCAEFDLPSIIQILFNSIIHEMRESF